MLRLNEKDRQYYTQVWGFDPVMECVPLTGGESQYRAEFPLPNDPGLANAGVTIAAEVTFSAEPRVINHIVFRRGNREGKVTCTHTIIYSGTVEDALTLATDGILGQAPTRTEEDLFTQAGTVALPPEEHFVALKSYVAAISEVGVEHLLGSSSPPNWGAWGDLGLSQPFGFNSAMRTQVVAALRAVAPQATTAILRNVFAELATEAGAEWFQSRLLLLDGMYFHALMRRSGLQAFFWRAGLSAPFTQFLVEVPDFFELMFDAVPCIPFVRAAVHWPGTPATVLAFLATSVQSVDWTEPAGARADYWSEVPVFRGGDMGLYQEFLRAHQEWDDSKGAINLTKVSFASGEGEWYHAHNDTLGYYALNHTNCPRTAIEIFARHPDSSIRCFVPLRNDVDPQILITLARDEDLHVRMAVAVNPLTPAEVLVELSRDEDLRVRSAVSWNPQI